MLVHGALVENGFGEAVQAVTAGGIFDEGVGVCGLDGLDEAGVIG